LRGEDTKTRGRENMDFAVIAQTLDCKGVAQAVRVGILYSRRLDKKDPAPWRSLLISGPGCPLRGTITIPGTPKPGESLLSIAGFEDTF
jgi:hypothetical protein